MGREYAAKSSDTDDHLLEDALKRLGTQQRIERRNPEADPSYRRAGMLDAQWVRGKCDIRTPLVQPALGAFYSIETQESDGRKLRNESGA